MGYRNMRTAISDKGKYLFKLAIVVTAVYFSVKYLLFLFFPFLLAYVIKLILNPIINVCEKKLGFSKKIISLIMLTLVSLMMVAILVLFTGIITKQIKKIVTNSGYYEKKVDKVTDRCCDIVEKYSGIESKEIRGYIDNGTSGVFKYMAESEMLYKVMGKSVNVMRSIIELVVMVFAAILSAYYMINKTVIKDSERCKNGNESKNALINDVKKLVKSITNVCVAYTKTQLIIMTFTFMVCFVGFIIIKSEYAFLFALVVGLLDSLPIIGVGTILVPVAIAYLIMGKYIKSVIIMIVFGICYMFREIMEPRLMGNRIGITPLTTIVSMYVGFNVFGVIGVLIGPVAYILIGEIMKIIE